MQNLTRDYLKGEYFKDKDHIIHTYMLSEFTNLDIYTYTKGKVVIIDKDTKRAYSKNGYFFSVILKDTKFLYKIEMGHKDDIIAYADSKLAKEYEDYESEEDGE